MTTLANTRGAPSRATPGRAANPRPRRPGPARPPGPGRGRPDRARGRAGRLAGRLARDPGAAVDPASPRDRGRTGPDDRGFADGAALAAPEAWTLLDGAFDDANEDLATFVRLARETASLPGSWASWDTGEAT
ncbi:hypothetical protein [Methylorubrum extorquens]|uniref:Uncharacterized protein n=1 Tax=Methylorubrum extorquens (strain ATCC 14718 / DSM 1338 / JCM 2805 / NCIMB 9133 / AM1) TaxID=272630 RepID=C5ASK3_METEA|nr:hypothetical protein [Methylorubrum extorquens]ACS40444.1 Hypothetical protein MexAM1_META1p2676 [Methylorubrum extorquens AM1]MCP1541411.1 hypothetical protein [Methylorubrum extorquens]MCP1586053.1 hypothetical protein [Methylorubrum extorquens]